MKLLARMYTTMQIKNVKGEKAMEISQVELEYVYFEAEEGGYVGYFKDFPQHVTQGETIEELEDMLLDMFECLNLAKYHTRKLAIA